VQHVGGGAQYDDLTVVTIGYTGTTDTWNVDKTRRVATRRTPNALPSSDG